jgi:hypothetical protein
VTPTRRRPEWCLITWPRSNSGMAARRRNATSTTHAMASHGPLEIAHEARRFSVFCGVPASGLVSARADRDRVCRRIANAIPIGRGRGAVSRTANGHPGATGRVVGIFRRFFPALAQTNVTDLRDLGADRQSARRPGVLALLGVSPRAGLVPHKAMWKPML